MKKEVCSECGNELYLEKVIDTTSVVMKCKQCKKKFKLDYEEKVFPKNINSFNLGAFATPVLWDMFNGISIYSLFFIILGGMAVGPLWIIIFPIRLLLGIYFGMKANRRSWYRKEWKSIEQFEKNQDNWNIVGFISVIIMVIFACVTLSEYMSL